MFTTASRRQIRKNQRNVLPNEYIASNHSGDLHSTFQQFAYDRSRCDIDSMYEAMTSCARVCRGNVYTDISSLVQCLACADPRTLKHLSSMWCARFGV